MQTVSIRQVRVEDSQRLLEIYAPYVEGTVITFETDIPSQAEFSERIRSTAQEYPYLVALIGEHIVAYAYAHRQMERAAYQWNATLSVYVEQAYHTRGIGKALYTCLLEILKLQNVQNVYGIVAAPNVKSEKLHESLGFKRLCIYPLTGYKLGAWHDVIWFEKSIGQHPVDPQPFRPIQAVEPAAIQAILTKGSSLVRTD